jgi:hypothetical protein
MTLSQPLLKALPVSQPPAPKQPSDAPNAGTSCNDFGTYRGTVQGASAAGAGAALAATVQAVGGPWVGGGAAPAVSHPCAVICLPPGGAGAGC